MNPVTPHLIVEEKTESNLMTVRLIKPRLNVRTKDICQSDTQTKPTKAQNSKLADTECYKQVANNKNAFKIGSKHSNKFFEALRSYTMMPSRTKVAIQKPHVGRAPKNCAVHNFDHTK